MTQPDCIRQVRTPLSSAVLFYNCDHQPFALSPSPTVLFLAFLLRILFLSLCCTSMRIFLSVFLTFFLQFCVFYFFRISLLPLSLSFSFFLTYSTFYLFLSSFSLFFQQYSWRAQAQTWSSQSLPAKYIWNSTNKYYQIYVKIYLPELMFISRNTKHRELI